MKNKETESMCVRFSQFAMSVTNAQDFANLRNLQKLYIFYLHDFIYISSIWRQHPSLQQSNELQRRASKSKSQVFFWTEFSLKFRYSVLRCFVRNVRRTHQIDECGQAGVYARATMRRTLRLQQRNTREESCVHTSGRDCPIQPSVAKWPRGTQTARDILAGRHLCAQRCVTACT